MERVHDWVAEAAGIAWGPTMLILLVGDGPVSDVQTWLEVRK